MIVIHTRCKFKKAEIKALCEGMENTTFLYNPKKKDVIEILRNNPTETLMCIGRGSTYGLYGRRFGELLIGDSMQELLQSREVIGLWRDAEEFARQYGLRGFFPNIFISDEFEWWDKSRGRVDEELNYRNVKFFSEMKRLIAENVPMNEWAEILRDVFAHDIDFMAMDDDAMEYLDGTEVYIPKFPESQDFETIETERLVLRRMTEDDAADLLKMCSDEDTAYWAGMPCMKDIDDALYYIECENRIQNGCMYGIRLKGDDKFIGEISIWVERDSNGARRSVLGYVLAKEHRGNGYMPEAVKSVAEHIFKHSRVPLVMVEIRADNLQSLAVAQKCGFVKNTDQITFRLNFYQKPLEEYFLYRTAANIE